MTLFSTYSTGENRVTASILAVLRALSLQHTERLLRAMVGESTLQLIDFSNQVAGDGPGVPDAIISASFRIMIETKTARNAVDAAQLQRHLDKLGAATESKKILLVLTPDATAPAQISRSVVWASFAGLHQAIEELLGDRKEVVSEREAFLLRELQAMLEKENLLAAADEVLVVAALWALDEYKHTSAYVCQPNRTFRDAGRIAFYTDGKIDPHIPKIVQTYEAVEFRRGTQTGRLGMVIDTLLDRGARQDGQQYKVLLLTAPDDPETLHLDAAVVNDSTSDAGRVIAFTQGQRYVSLQRLKSAKWTSQLSRKDT
jgi:hypothetical protein